MNKKNKKLDKIDYGRELTVRRVEYSDDNFIDSETIFTTDVDQFLPDTEEFDIDWNVNTYIDDYLSFFDFSTEEEKEFCREALFSSKLRYLAVDSFAKWIRQI